MPVHEENLAAFVKSKGVIKVEKRQVDKPGKNEVLLRMKSVGICGTDVHYWKDGYMGNFVLTAPMVTGHEASGEVIEVGEGVTNLKVGDRVAVEPGTPCRMCEFCKGGRYSLCLGIRCPSLPPTHGAMQKYFVHTADYCFKLPDKISDDEGAVVEPLACAVHACRRAGVTAGDKVLITGAGPIGTLVLLVAKAMGATHVCITDIRQDRLDFALKHGADHAVLVDKATDETTLVKLIHEKLGDAPNVTLECSGAEASTRIALKATKSGGTVALVGLGPKEIRVPIVDAAVREVDIRGVYRFSSRCFPIAISLIETGAVDVKPLITHHFKLEEALEAFEQVVTGKGGVTLKVLVHC